MSVLAGWWTIQLVCTLTANDTVTQFPYNLLDCYKNETHIIDDNGGRRNIFHPQHRLYYRCDDEEGDWKDGDGDGDGDDDDDESKILSSLKCQREWPPLDAVVQDKPFFQDYRDFIRNVTFLLNDGNFNANASSLARPYVWATFPTTPPIPSEAKIRCQPHRQLRRHFQCVLDDRVTKKKAAYDWTFLTVIVFIAAGGLGNTLVCLAVCLDRNLQNVTNYFLLSLAVADLLVSLFVMPLGAIQGFFGYWPLGVVWCNVYVSCDVLACSCSIMHMCCISLGRYLGIRNPLKTRRHSYASKRLVGIKVAIVWALSLIVAGSVTILGLSNRHNIMPQPDMCVINNRAFFVFGSLVAFYIPMFIMVVTYALTVQLLRKKARFLQEKNRGGGSIAFRRIVAKPISSSATTPADEKPPPAFNLLRKMTLKRSSSVSMDRPPSASFATSQPNLNGKSPDEVEGTAKASRLTRLRLPLISACRFVSAGKRRRNSAAFGATTGTASALRTEQKASKVLGLVFFTFVLCWAPFFSLNIVFAACPRPKCNIPDNVVDVTLWLGYVSSTINPIIYTVFNRTFRTAFIRILRCKCRSLSRPRPLHYRSVIEARKPSAILLAGKRPSSAGSTPSPFSQLQRPSFEATPNTATIALSIISSNTPS